MVNIATDKQREASWFSTKMPIPRNFKKVEGAGFPPGPKSPDVPGTSAVLGGRYQIEAKLGSGNFGTAYLVTDLRESER